jgi:hypothetical protein
MSSLEVHMALEFRTRDESYKGRRIFPNGEIIQQARVFVDHLPPGLSTTPYNPYLVNDRYSHRPRYVIEAHIMVEPSVLSLLSIPTKGQVPTDRPYVQVVGNTSIEKAGLDLLLMHGGHAYQGTLYPIPELTAEAHQQHLARQRPRLP